MENNILLLEDDSILSKEIISYLNQHQIQCDHVSDGIEFLKIFNTKHYSIFILDINVPRINGVEILKEIRKNDKETPVLMLTAYSEIEDKQAAFDAGADDYLAKPFHLNELLMRIIWIKHCWKEIFTQMVHFLPASFFSIILPKKYSSSLG